MTTNLTDPQAPVSDEELDQMIWKLERDDMTPKMLSLMRELREVRRAATPTDDERIMAIEGISPQFKPVADLYGITSPTGSETTFTFDAGEASRFADSGWSVQEYVELERYQEAMIGNFRENVNSSTDCPKCGGRGTYHCPQMLGTVECECTLPAASAASANAKLTIILSDTSSKAFWSGSGRNEVFHPETYKRWVKEAIERFCIIASVDVEVK